MSDLHSKKVKPGGYPVPAPKEEFAGGVADLDKIYGPPDGVMFDVWRIVTETVGTVVSGENGKLSPREAAFQIIAQQKPVTEMQDARVLYRFPTGPDGGWCEVTVNDNPEPLL